MKNILTIACVAMLLSATSCKAQDMYKEIDDISYVSREDTSAYRQERCKLDMYYPVHAKRPFKTIVWFHGGGLTEGHKDIPGDLKTKESPSWLPTTGSTRELTIPNIQRMPQNPLRGW